MFKEEDSRRGHMKSLLAVAAAAVTAPIFAEQAPQKFAARFHINPDGHPHLPDMPPSAPGQNQEFTYIWTNLPRGATAKETKATLHVQDGKQPPVPITLETQQIGRQNEIEALADLSALVEPGNPYQLSLTLKGQRGKVISQSTQTYEVPNTIWSVNFRRANKAPRQQIKGEIQGGLFNNVAETGEIRSITAQRVVLRDGYAMCFPARNQPSGIDIDFDLTEEQAKLSEAGKLPYWIHTFDIASTTKDQFGGRIANARRNVLLNGTSLLEHQEDHVLDKGHTEMHGFKLDPEKKNMQLKAGENKVSVRAGLGGTTRYWHVGALMAEGELNEGNLQRAANYAPDENGPWQKKLPISRPLVL